MTNNITPIRPPKKLTQDEIIRQTIDEFATGNHSQYSEIAEEVWNDFDVVELLMVVAENDGDFAMIGERVNAYVFDMIKHKLKEN
mgnify:FL=1|tara:strand:- start:3814 stop:4068 length:255 start_codon:yes stop_codon:yes gene_type:complete